jgi:hypothetical protein
MKQSIIRALTIILFSVAFTIGCGPAATGTTTSISTHNTYSSIPTSTVVVTSTQTATNTVTATATGLPESTTGSIPAVDNDRDGIDDTVENQLISRFAPIVKLHPEEQYLPANVPWLLSRMRLRFDVSLGKDKQLLDKMQVTSASLITQSYDDQSSGLSDSPTDFFLEAVDASGSGSLEDYRKATRAGLDAAGWVCYAHVHGSPVHVGYYDIQYIFYYAYNGDTFSGPGSIAHESDFEHITVRVEPDRETVSQIYYAAHNNEGKWYKQQTSQGVKDGFSVTGDGRPVVYSAQNSHASYPWAGSWQRNNVPDDHTAGDGPVWDCLQSARDLGEKQYPAKDMQWIQYSGHWGELGTASFTTGPAGPAYQSWWNSEPQ